MKSRFALLVGIFVVGTLQVHSAHAGEYAKAVSYDQYSETKLEKCYEEKFAGEKVKKCIKAGTIVGGVNGEASLLTFTHADTGEIGAVLMIEQNFVVNLFGQKIEVGAVCSYNNSKKSETGVFFGYQLTIPPIPSVSVKDIIVAIITKGMKAGVGKMAGKSSTAKIATSGGSKKVSSGYAGSVSGNDYNKLMSPAASGCSINAPDIKIFSGIPSVNLVKAGIEFAMSADKIIVNTDTGGASVTLKTSMQAIANVGNEKVSFKVAGKKFSWKLPGFTVSEGKTLVNNKISIP